jgi:hypothetical protein
MATELETAMTGLSESQTALNGAVVVIADAVAQKQDTLVSGTNIKTINGASVLGGGDISVSLPPSVSISLI